MNAGFSNLLRAVLGGTNASAWITGTPGVGNVLTANLAPALGTASTWQWTRNGTNISGATSSTYTQQSADLGTTVGVLINGTYSASVAVPGIAPAVTSAPSVSSATTAAGLTWTPGVYTGTPTPTVTANVYVNGALVASNVTQGSYTPTLVGGSLVVTETATNVAGSVQSSSTAVTISSAVLRGLAANNYFPQGTQAVATNVATTVETYERIPYIIGVDSTDLVIRFPNWFIFANNGVKYPGNAFQVVECAIEYNGTYAAVQFSGTGGATVANGSDVASDTFLASSVGASKFSKGTLAYVRFRRRFSAPSTDVSPHMGGGKGTAPASYVCDPTKVNVTNGVMGTGIFAYTMTNGGVNGTDIKSTFYTYMPILLGHHNAPCPAMLGDSKTYGTGDSAPAATGAGGMSRLAFTDPTNATTVICPSINMGIPSGNASDWSTSIGGADITLPRAYLNYCTHAVAGYGTNGFQTTQLQTLYGYVRSAGIPKIIQRSLTPNVTGLSLAITGLTSSGTACTGTMASTASLVNGNTYTIAGCTPSAYNGSYVVTVVNSTTFTYTSATAPGGSSTVNGTVADQYRTTAGQTPVSGYSTGGAADTYEATLRGWLSSDANLTYYQSQGERSATSGTGYWLWGVNGTANYETSDGKHEARYEDNIGIAGQILTQAGGTVSSSLRSYFNSWVTS